MTLAALEGFTVGVTADRRWEQQADLLRQRGAEVLHGPTIATGYLAETEELLRITQEVVGGADYTVVTTGIGVRAWFEAAESLGMGPALRSALAASRILCRGPKTSAALKVAGIKAFPVREADSLAELLDADALSMVGGARVAFQHHGGADRSWVDRLESAGATVIGVRVYRWQRPPSEAAALRLIRAVCDGAVDAVTFTSAPAAANLIDIAARHGLRCALLDAFDRDVLAACVGAVCAKGARDHGIARALAPEAGRLGLMIRLVTDALAGRRRQWSWGGRAAALQGRALALGSEKLRLSATEGRLMAALVERPGAVVAKTTLARRAGSSPRAVEAAVGRLRTRLGGAGPELVQTVPLRGYRLSALSHGRVAPISLPASPRRR